MRQWNFVSAVALCACACSWLGCGSSIPREQLLANLHQAMQEDVADSAGSASHSRVVEAALDENALDGLRRDEVEERIGRGEPCSRHPRCGEHDFVDNDWFYEVGRPSQGYGSALPLLIVGFDRSGRVDRTWSLHTN
ncbi:MAG: hypothetical protein GW913_15065 [Myxococcales bacterium]|nr:hypothetical protein [Myxococcales bacterium]